MPCIRCTCCKGKGYFMRRYCDEVIKVACSSCNSSGEIWKKIMKTTLENEVTRLKRTCTFTTFTRVGKKEHIKRNELFI